MTFKGKASASNKNADARLRTIKQCIWREIMGKEKVGRQFIRKQLEATSKELYDAAKSEKNSGLRGLIAVYLSGLACIFVKK